MVFAKLELKGNVRNVTTEFKLGKDWHMRTRGRYGAVKRWQNSITLTNGVK